MIDIYHYQDYRHYLKDYYRAEKQRSRAFSFRYFARRAQLPSFNYLKLVMEGKRGLSADYLKRFTKGLKLDLRQAKYFEAMVGMNQAKDAAVKADYLSRMLETCHRITARQISSDQQSVYHQWYHWVIREMAWLPDFKPDPQWIARRLDKSITSAQAKESLALLKKLGLIQKEKGRWMPSDRAVKTSDERVDLFIKKIHVAFIRKALEALLNVSLEEREFGGLTIALPKDKVSLVKEKIKAFRSELNEILSSAEGPQEIYQFNMQFYPLTRRIE